MDTQLLTIVLVVAVALAALGWWYWAKRRRDHLRDRFGPEYTRAVHEHGTARRAEAALEAREKRVEGLKIRPLSPEDSGRFAERWRQVQAAFVDNPQQAVKDADRLVDEVMNARGYPTAEFEQRATDISVDHPRVVENYRAARAIAERHAAGQANTEDLRQAMVQYRALFEDLLEPEPAAVRRTQ